MSTAANVKAHGAPRQNRSMTVQQTVTPELRQWIIAQAQAGHPPDTVLQAMRASGWDEDVAIAAMEDTLQGFLAEHQAKQREQPPARPAPVEEVLPPGVPVPDAALGESPVWVDGGDRRVQIVMAMKHPRVIVFGSLLSDEECDAIVAAARPRMARSETVVVDTGGSEVNEARTSRGMFFERGENAVCKRIEQRIATLLAWPVINGEGLQVLHYLPGAEYRPHHDYFDPVKSGTAAITSRGGQRVGTLIMYLNSPDKGGGTTFPDVGLEVAPVKGNAVFFSYDRPHVSTKTLHGGAPVIAGEKWVATKWLREGEFK
jgi:prolyl 4-hydroxylase